MMTPYEFEQNILKYPEDQNIVINFIDILTDMNPNGFDFVRFAINAKKFEVAKALLKHGARLEKDVYFNVFRLPKNEEVKDLIKVTSQHFFGNENIAELLHKDLSYNFSNYNEIVSAICTTLTKTDSQYNNALQYAAIAGYNQVISKYFDLCTEQNNHHHFPEYSKHSVLQLAILNSHLDTAIVYIDRASTLQYPNSNLLKTMKPICYYMTQKDSQYNNALQYAAIAGYTQIISKYFDLCTRQDDHHHFPTYSDHSVLQLAILNSHLDTAIVYIDRASALQYPNSHLLKTIKLKTIKLKTMTPICYYMTQQDSQYNNALQYAAIAGYTQIISKYFDLCHDHQYAHDHFPGYSKHSVLQLAILNSHFDTAIVYIDRASTFQYPNQNLLKIMKQKIMKQKTMKPICDYMTQQDSQYNNALQYAAIAGYTQIISKYFDLCHYHQYAHHHFPGYSKHSVLQLAILNSHLDTAIVYIDRASTFQYSNQNLQKTKPICDYMTQQDSQYNNVLEVAALKSLSNREYIKILDKYDAICSDILDQANPLEISALKSFVNNDINSLPSLNYAVKLFEIADFYEFNDAKDEIISKYGEENIIAAMYNVSYNLGYYGLKVTHHLIFGSTLINLISSMFHNPSLGDDRVSNMVVYYTHKLFTGPKAILKVDGNDYSSRDVMLEIFKYHTDYSLVKIMTKPTLWSDISNKVTSTFFSAFAINVFISQKYDKAFTKAAVEVYSSTNTYIKEYGAPPLACWYLMKEIPVALKETGEKLVSMPFEIYDWLVESYSQGGEDIDSIGCIDTNCIDTNWVS